MEKPQFKYYNQTFSCFNFRASCSVCNVWTAPSKVDTISCDWNTNVKQTFWNCAKKITWDGLRLTFWKSSETCLMTDCSSWHWICSFFIFLSASCLSSSSSSLYVCNEESALLQNPTWCMWRSSGDISPGVEHRTTHTSPLLNARLGFLFHFAQATTCALPPFAHMNYPTDFSRMLFRNFHMNK